jgi:hypothetical protein
MRSLELLSRTSARFVLAASSVACAGFTAISLAGCPDPAGAFEEFGERYEEVNPTTTTTTTSTGPSTCPLPEPGAADGQYFFTLDPKPLVSGTPFTLLATVTTTASGDGLSVELVMQPLSKTDRKTPTGSPLPTFTGLAVAADGSFEWDLGEVTFPGEANPISDSEVVATVQLQGSLCDSEPAESGSHAGFVCGSATGLVTKPLTDFPLDGSTFTMQLVEGGALPDALINCNKDAADPL